jgi:hypothetical protein
VLWFVAVLRIGNDSGWGRTGRRVRHSVMIGTRIWFSIMVKAMLM